MAYGLTREQQAQVSQSVPALGAPHSGKAFGDIINALYKWGGVIVPVTFAAAATKQAVTHNLGYTPNGYVVVGATAGGIVYNGGDASTTATISLQASAAGTYQVLVF